ncbi:MAG: IS200/IS605 family transposase [Phycisphaerales bacterium]|nr:IS200/IS605 family transposase [Phycisphaerales bacterium]
MAHSFHKLVIHAIFSTKDRRPLITPDIAARLHPYLGGIIRELNGTALTVGGVADHVHILMQIPATLSLSDAMRLIKTNSSKWAHETLVPAFGWQTGYGAFSVSQSNIETVRRYIENQEEHHRHVTFQEEFIEFLKRHEIEYDEKYIWE